MEKIDFTSDESSTSNEWTEEETHDFMSSINKPFKWQKPRPQQKLGVPNLSPYRPLQGVDIDDPRPPIKQRLGVESKPAKCGICYSDRLYSDDRERYICPFCNHG